MKKKLMVLMTCLFMGIGLVNAQTQKVTGTVISDEEYMQLYGQQQLSLNGFKKQTKKVEVKPQPKLVETKPTPIEKSVTITKKEETVKIITKPV